MRIKVCRIVVRGSVRANINAIEDYYKMSNHNVLIITEGKARNKVYWEYG